MKTDIGYVNVIGKIFSHQIFKSCLFKNIRDFRFEHCIFLEGCVFKGQIQEAYFDNCIMPDVDMKYAEIRWSTFKGCDMKTANLFGTKIMCKSHLILCDLRYIMLHQKIIQWDCVLRGCYLPKEVAQIVIEDKTTLVDAQLIKEFLEHKIS